MWAGQVLFDEIKYGVDKHDAEEEEILEGKSTNR